MVEDEPGLRFLTTDVLREEGGFEVLEAHSADEAVRLLEGGARVDLVFTDVRMPGVRDGLDLAKLVLANYPAIRVVITSGNLHPTGRIDGVPFVAKPYDLPSLVAQLTALLQ